MDHSEIIGKLVISSNFGIGTVVSVEDMTNSGRDFLVIECPGNVKNFIPADDTASYRFLSTEVDIGKIISKLEKTRLKPKDYGSKKERIEYFKKTSKMQDINIIADLLLELISLDDRSSAEDLIMNKFVDSIALEHSIITKAKEEDSKVIILAAIK